MSLVGGRSAGRHPPALPLVFISCNLCIIKCTLLTSLYCCGWRALFASLLVILGPAGRLTPQLWLYWLVPLSVSVAVGTWLVVWTLALQALVQSQICVGSTHPRWQQKDSKLINQNQKVYSLSHCSLSSHEPWKSDRLTHCTERNGWTISSQR